MNDIMNDENITEIMINGYYSEGIKRFRTRHIEQIRGYIIDSRYEGKKSVRSFIQGSTKAF